MASTSNENNKKIKHHSDLLNEEVHRRSKQVHESRDAKGLNNEAGARNTLDTLPAHSLVIDSIVEHVQKGINPKEDKDGFELKDKHKEKIREGLQNVFAQFTRAELEHEKGSLVADISKALIKNRTQWTKIKNFLGIKSYSISRDKIKKIADEVVHTRQKAKAGAKEIGNNMNTDSEHTPQSDFEKKQAIAKKMGGRSVM